MIVNNCSEFQVNIFSNNRDIRLHLEISWSKKEHNFVKKNGGLPPLLVWVPLFIVNNCSEFQVNIFSNNRDIRKCQCFRTTADGDDATDNDARAMTIPRRFLRKQPSYNYPKRGCVRTARTPCIRAWVALLFHWFCPLSFRQRLSLSLKNKSVSFLILLFLTYTCNVYDFSIFVAFVLEAFILEYSLQKGGKMESVVESKIKGLGLGLGQ